MIQDSGFLEQNDVSIFCTYVILPFPVYTYMKNIVVFVHKQYIGFLYIIWFLVHKQYSGLIKKLKKKIYIYIHTKNKYIIYT